MPLISFDDGVVDDEVVISEEPLISESFELYETLVYELNTIHYGTVEKGDDYFNQQIGGLEWLTATYADKRKALVEATRLIDNLNYICTKLVATQRLEFPRDFQETVPEAIEQAAYEIARKLLDGFDVDAVIRDMGVKRRKYSSVETEYAERAGIPENILALIPSVKAWYLLKPYLYDGQSVSLQRIS